MSAMVFYLQQDIGVNIYFKNKFYVIITFKLFRMLGYITAWQDSKHDFCLLNLIDRAGTTFFPAIINHDKGYVELSVIIFIHIYPKF